MKTIRINAPTAVTGTFAQKTGKSESFPAAVVPTATANRKLYTQRRKNFICESKRGVTFTPSQTHNADRSFPGHQK